MIRRLLLWALIILFVWVVIREFDQIKMFVETLARGKLVWVLVAIGLVVVFNLVTALSYRVAFAAADMHLGMRTILPVLLASMFVGVVAPGGSTTGLALFVDDAVRRGYSAARATVGVMLQLVSDFAGLTIVMGIGLIYTQIRGEMNYYALASVGIILAITASLLGAILLGSWKPGFLKRLFMFFQRLVNALAARLRQPAFLEQGWAEESSEEFIEAASVMVRNPGRVLPITLLMLVTNVIDVTTLKVLFTCFGYNIGVGPLVAGYSMMSLADMLSPVPQGIGIIEGAMVYAFDAMGVPWEYNLTTSLAYRGLSFWLPLIAGVFLLRQVKTFQVEKKPPVPGDSIPWLATLMAILGALNILGVLAPSTTSRVVLLGNYSPFFVPPAYALTAIASGLLLFMLALGLFRRKRLVWLVSLILVIGIISAHVVMGGPRDQQAILGSLIGVWLVFLTPHFTNRSESKSIRLGLYGLAGGLALVLILWATVQLGPDVLSLVGLAALAFFIFMVGRSTRVDENLDSTLAKIGRITNIEKYLQRQFGAQDVMDSYSEDDSLYQRVYSQAGSIHISLSEDGRFHRDGYYGQAGRIQKVIQATNAQNVLELCSGKGFNLIYLAKNNPHIKFSGVDFTPGYVRASQDRSRSLDNLSCQVGNIQELEYPSETFDILFTIESLFNVCDLAKALSAAYRVLKPGGRMIVFDFYRQKDLEAVEPVERDAIRISENSFDILCPMSVNGFVEAAQMAGFKALKVEDLSHNALPDVVRLHRLVDLAFKVPLLTKMLARILSSNMIDVIVGWELMPALFTAGLTGYYQVELERP